MLKPAKGVVCDRIVVQTSGCFVPSVSVSLRLCGFRDVDAAPAHVLSAGMKLQLEVSLLSLMIRPLGAADVYPPRGAIVVTQSFPQDGILNSFLNLGTTWLHVPKLSWKEIHYLARSMIKPQQHLFSTRIIKTRLYKVFSPS